MFTLFFQLGYFRENDTSFDVIIATLKLHKLDLVFHTDNYVFKDSTQVLLL